MLGENSGKIGEIMSQYFKELRDGNQVPLPAFAQPQMNQKTLILRELYLSDGIS
jgi:hypothetical protein